MQRHLGLAPVIIFSFLLAGCASQTGSQPTVAPATGSPASSSDGTIYVANFKGNDIGAYAIHQRSLKLLRTVTSDIDQPRALAVDSSGTLYVANANDITEYAGGEGTPIATISTGIDSPSELLLDSKQNLYVLNQNTITVYAPEMTKPSLTISQSLVAPQAMTFGYSDGSLYVANCPSCVAHPRRTSKKQKDSINIYSPVTGTLLQSITKAIKHPSSIVATRLSLIVANYGNNSVTAYDSVTFKLLAKTTEEVVKPTFVSYSDIGGYIWVMNQSNITSYELSNFEYVAGYDVPIDSPQAFISDGALNVWVASAGANSVNGYFYGGSGVRPDGVTTNGIDDPVALAIGP